MRGRCLIVSQLATQKSENAAEFYFLLLHFLGTILIQHDGEFHHSCIVRDSYHVLFTYDPAIAGTKVSEFPNRLTAAIYPFRLTKRPHHSHYPSNKGRSILSLKRKESPLLVQTNKILLHDGLYNFIIYNSQLVLSRHNHISITTLFYIILSLIL